MIFDMIILNHSLTHYSILIALKLLKSLAYIMDTGICGNSPLYCCPNYYKENNSCIECPSGSYQNNCSKKCPINYYGRLCLEICNCASDETCDAEKGCIIDEINKKSKFFQFALMSFGVLLAVLTVVGISYTFARKLQHFHQNVSDSIDPSFRKSNVENNTEIQDRNKKLLDIGTAYSCTSESSFATERKAHVYGCCKMEKDMLLKHTMQTSDYCIDSYYSRSSTSDRCYSLNENSPVSGSCSGTSLLYLRPSDLHSASLIDVGNTFQNAKSPPYSERDTYVEKQINLANSEERVHNHTENIQDTLSHQDHKNMKESTSKNNVYDLAVPTADKIKGTVVPNDQQLFLKVLSNQILKMKRKE